MSDDDQLRGVRWGSAREHVRTFAPAAGNGRRICHHCRCMGSPCRATHVGMANGIALMSGCEWHVRKWARETP